MNRILAAALVAGVALVPVSAIALDRVEGVVERVDTTANIFTIRASGATKSPMSFKLDAETFDGLALDVDDWLSVEYDRAECGTTPGCVPIAKKVDRRS